jgi:hypothetical protein
MAAAATTFLRTVLLLAFLVHVLNAATASARTMKGDRWLQGGVEMLVDLLGDLKSGNNPGTHCC